MAWLRGPYLAVRLVVLMTVPMGTPVPLQGGSWLQVSALVALDVVDNAPNNKWQIKNVTHPSLKVVVRVEGSFLLYKAFRASDNELLTYGMIPSWMVVYALYEV